MPSAFVTRLEKQFGERWETIKNALESTPETSVLLNALKDSGQFNGLHRVSWCEEGRILPERMVFAADPLWHAGTYYVQEAASMFVCRALETISGAENLRILDLCASPGGKSHLIQNFLKGKGLLISNEISMARAIILKTNVQRFGHPNTAVISGDPQELAKSGVVFDVVLCDAPCSGEGMFRKDHGARREWNPGLPDFCAHRQKGIIQAAAAMVKAGGYLVYSTCTFAEQENEEQVLSLWEKGGWEFVQIGRKPEWGVEEIAQDRLTAYRLMPGLTAGGEGFFIAVLRKTESSVEFRRKEGESVFQPFRSSEESEWMGLLRSKERVFRDVKGNLWQLTPELHELLPVIATKAKILNAGTSLGTIIGKEFIPDQGLATSLDLADEGPSVELDLEKARVFLRGGDPGRELFSRPGWNLVRYNGFGIGWVKVLERRVNNYYPKQLRLLHY